MNDVYISYLSSENILMIKYGIIVEKLFPRACCDYIVYYSYHDAMSSRRFSSWPINERALSLLLFGLRTH